MSSEYTRSPNEALHNRSRIYANAPPGNSRPEQSTFNRFASRLIKFTRKHSPFNRPNMSESMIEDDDDDEEAAVNIEMLPRTSNDQFVAASASSSLTTNVASVAVSNVIATTAATTAIPFNRIVLNYGRRSALKHKIQHMRSEHNRVKSFASANWTCTNLNKYDLARNGFYYLGEGDSIRCVYCQLMLQQINVFDDIESLHQRFGTKCPIVLNILEPNEIGKKYPRLSQTNVRRILTFDDDVTPVRQKVRRNEYDEMSSALSPDDIIYPKYKTMSSRLRTYETWPHFSHPRPYNMAAAGFYYIKVSDHVQCYSCEIYLNCFEASDDPWDFHIKWSPMCPHVNACRSKQFIRETFERMLYVNGAYFVKSPKRKCLCTRQNRDAQILNDASSASDDDDDATAGNNRTGTVETAIDNDFQASANVVVPTLRQEEKNILCCICLEKEMDTLYFPCAHLVACAECTTLMHQRKCPICRCFIERYLRVYIGK